MFIDPKVCPFCKKPNFCEAHVPNNDCWCNYAKVPIELRELIPNKFRMKACICKTCVESFKKEPEIFRLKFSK